MKIPVLIPNIFNHPFTYETDLDLEIGDYVMVPFGKSSLTGIVWDHFEKQNNKNFLTKKISSRLDINPLSKKTINFLNWFSDYNLIPKGMSLKLHLLSGEAIVNFKKNEYKKFNEILPSINYQLNESQNKTYLEVSRLNEKFNVHLLQGATGSGKTLVYFNLIKDKIDQDKQALILLPEIGLTSEFEKKFIEFFGFKPAIWHSGVTKKNKKIIWSGLASNKIKVVIGARSSLFLPFKKLGLIVVDEEHDQSYKQDEGVIYNARDMAVSRASFENIPINLVTAVPSLETYSNVIKKKYSHSRLLNRFKNASLPSCEIIDLNKFKLVNKSWISSKTFEKVNYHLEKGDQVLFFLNRRGYSPNVICKNCLKSFVCKNCSINLVYHKNIKKLLCHYCGTKHELKRECENNISGSCKFIFTGPGVEKVLDEVNTLFPKFKASIFSSDTMNKKNSSSILENISNNKIKILVGTQLISKGFHFPNLNCIIVLDIDLSSQGHDLRSGEKNLQLYHQLAGRAGRTGKASNIYFQTLIMNKEKLNDITSSDPYDYLEKELNLRKLNNLPPFQRFISIILSSEDEKALDDESLKLQKALKQNLKAQILGPVNAPIHKIKKKYRNRLLIRASKSYKIQKFLAKILHDFKFSKKIKLSVDVDPISFN
ncbi:MAG: primosomal protein N' [Candidatus Pelagibacter sp.]